MCRRTLALAAAGCCLTACGVESLAPIVRLEITPSFLCAGDQSAVLTFAAEATPAFADAPDATPYTYAWDLAPAPIEIVSGSLRGDLVQARFAADRPIDVRLEARAGAAAGHRHTTLALGATDLPACATAADCRGGDECAPIAGRGVCTPARTCLDDSYCPCLRCGRTDSGTQRCLPR